uniref:Protein ARV n=1 Tax=Globodera pallida TaxID=36090 RepID=A0A183CCB9_GLOPA
MRPASSLFTLYSAGVLQYRQAYRHVLFNSNSKSFNRLIFIFVLCDAYKAWIERVEHLPGGQILFDLEWRFYLSLLRSAAEFGAYTSALFCFLKFFGQFDKFAGGSRGLKCFFESTLIGFYGSLFVVVSIIWQLHGHLSYRLLTRLFIFLSHLQFLHKLSQEWPSKSFQCISDAMRQRHRRRGGEWNFVAMDGVGKTELFLQ